MDPASITPVICLVGFIVVIAIFFFASAIKVVPEYQRLVVFRLGRCIGDKGPGLVLLIPVIDRPVRVDLREQVREIPHQTSITKDNAPISLISSGTQTGEPDRKRITGR
jgi:regulator of protease activity HflC (stomatin/prohibitin superfamily)